MKGEQGVRSLPDAGQVGKVERRWRWQAGVFVFVEDDGTVQVRHGVEDQREDTIRLDQHEATELAYLLLWVAELRTWTVASPTDLARRRVAFRRVVEAGDRDMREALERVDQMYRDDPRPDEPARN